MYRHAHLICMTPEQLAAVLFGGARVTYQNGTPLPEGVEVLHAFWSADRGGLVVTVAHPSFDERHPGDAVSTLFTRVQE